MGTLSIFYNNFKTIWLERKETANKKIDHIL